jgi:hypothetical protein
MLRKSTVFAAVVAVLSIGLDTADGFAQVGGGRAGGGVGSARSGAPGAVGTASQGAAMATQQRMAPPSVTPGPQISVPSTGNPVSQSTLSRLPAAVGPAPGYGAAGGGRPGQLPSDVRSREGRISTYDRAVDRDLNICKGC